MRRVKPLPMVIMRKWKGHLRAWTRPRMIFVGSIQKPQTFPAVFANVEGRRQVAKASKAMQDAHCRVSHCNRPA
jgi:hypothetical protein